RSLLQSGNVVFSAAHRTPTALESLLEKHLAKTLDLRTTFFVRTADELEDTIRHNPFPDQAKNDPGHLVVEFLKDTPSATAVKQLRAAIKGRRRRTLTTSTSTSSTRRASAARSSATSSSKTNS